MKRVRQFLLLQAILLLSICVASAQSGGAITGSVTDENGEPLVGVTIMQSGTHFGTATDAHGDFSFAPHAEGEKELIISYIGFATQTIPITSSRTALDIKLVADAVNLEEVVAVGYGTMKRSDLTGAVSSVDVDKVNLAPSTDVFRSLQGAIAGLDISGATGEPGSSVTINIRGTNSIAAGNEPLIVVDGFPLSDGESINDINPQDIEKMDVLKDASSTAIYGSRGSNGVILITTKKAAGDGVVVKYSGYVSVATQTEKLDYMSGDELYNFRREGMKNAGKTDLSMESVLNNDEKMINAYKNGDYIDWQDEIFSTAFTHDHNLTVLYRTKVVNNFFSVNYHDEKGLVEDTGYEKIGLRNNLIIKPADWLEIGSNLNLARSRFEDSPNGVISSALSQSPIGSIYDLETGALDSYVNNEMYVDGSTNPVAILEKKDKERERWRLMANVYANFKIISGLKYRIALGVDETFTDTNEWTGALANVEDSEGGNALIRNSRRSTFNMDNMLTYDKKFGKNRHSLNVTLLHNIYQYRSYNTEMTNKDFPTQELSWGQIGEGTTPTVDRDDNNWNLQSFMGRVNYSYRNKYLLTAAVRYDGSSKFGPNNKYALFPSAALAWKIDQEPFMKSLKKTVSQLKMRFSYGVSGNQDIGTYGYVSYPSTAQYKYENDEKFYYYAYPIGGDYRVGNENLKWEATTTYNLGVDFGLLKNRISGSIELYHSKTNDLLISRPVPRSNGFVNMYDNVGAVVNKGVELSLNGHIFDKKDFGWQVGLNYTRNKNIYVESNILDEDGNYADDLVGGYIVGEPVRSVYARVSLGLFSSWEDIYNHGYMKKNEDGTGEWVLYQPEAKPGEIKFADVNNDGVVDNEDRAAQGSPNPDWYGSIRNMFRYKNLSLSFVFSTKQGMTKINEWITKIDYRGRYSIPNLSYWTEDNTDALLPRPSSSVKYYDDVEAIAIQDASYIMLQNVTLNYSFSKKICNKLRLSALQVGLSGNNLKYWSDYFGYSPESSSYDSYPMTRTFALNVNVTF